MTRDRAVGPIRVLVVRDARPVREFRLHPRMALRLGVWAFVGAWLVPVLVLAAVAVHARMERAVLARDVAVLTERATGLSTAIAELQRAAGLPNRADGEGGPAGTPPEAGARADADAAADFVTGLSRRFAGVAAVMRERIVRSRATPTGSPVPAARQSSAFGWRANPFTGEGAEWHAGLDLPAPVGTPVLATADGEVESVATSGGYGLAVVLRHGAGFATLFGHLRDATVRAGDPVERGALIGHVGSGGRSTGPHVHYEVRRDGRPVNPHGVRAPHPALPAP